MEGMKLMRPLYLAIACTALLAGCTVPGVPGLGSLTGPTVSGQVTGAAAGWRVALVGSPKAGGAAIEIASAPVQGSGYTLAFPGSPPLSLLEQPAEERSVVFTLRAYQDANGNDRLDAGERQSPSPVGSFRWFALDGPAGAYRQGWNQFRNGTYSQQFDVALDLATGS